MYFFFFCLLPFLSFFHVFSLTVVSFSYVLRSIYLLFPGVRTVDARHKYVPSLVVASDTACIPQEGGVNTPVYRITNGMYGTVRTQAYRGYLYPSSESFGKVRYGPQCSTESGMVR